MEDFRSKSCKKDRFYEAEAKAKAKAPPSSMQDLQRSYSTSYAAAYPTTNHHEVVPGNKEIKQKKSKSNFGSAYSKSWSFNDPELQRKKRVASYKVYTVDGKMKGSLRKSFKWIKNTCSQMIYGWK